MSKSTSPYQKVSVLKKKEEWEKAEKNRKLGYNGLSQRTRERRAKDARDAEKTRKQVKTMCAPLSSFLYGLWPLTPFSNDSTTPQTRLMQAFFVPDKTPASQNLEPESVSAPGVLPPSELARYLSDVESDSECDEAEGEERGDDRDDREGEDTEECRRKGTSASPMVPAPRSLPSASASSAIHAPVVPAPNTLARKRRKLDIPVRVSIQIKQRERREERECALNDIQKLIKAKKTKFDGGPTGLQSYRARAIASHLNMVVHDRVPSILAARRAAQSQGFSENWGGRSVSCWVSSWIKTRTLPTSRRGCHGKVYSLLDDPAIKAELRAYVRSRK